MNTNLMVSASFSPLFPQVDFRKSYLMLKGTINMIYFQEKFDDDSDYFRDRIYRALEQLPERLRDIIKKILFEHVPISIVATQYGVPENEVLVQLTTGFLMLRNILNEPVDVEKQEVPDDESPNTLEGEIPDYISMMESAEEFSRQNRWDDAVLALLGAADGANAASDHIKMAAALHRVGEIFIKRAEATRGAKDRQSFIEKAQAYFSRAWQEVKNHRTGR